MKVIMCFQASGQIPFCSRSLDFCDSLLQPGIKIVNFRPVQTFKSRLEFQKLGLFDGVHKFGGSSFVILLIRDIQRRSKANLAIL